VKSKHSDEIFIAVASNNIVVVKQEHDLFDSFKKLKQATSQTLEQKLSIQQKKVIGFNRCLLLLHMHKGDQCRELVKLLSEQFPDSEELNLILASLLWKEKKIGKCEELLTGFANDHPNNSLKIQLSLAQVHLNNGNFVGCIKALESISQLRNKPRFVGTLVGLYEQLRDINGALQILDAHMAWWDSLKQKNQEEYIKVLKYVANFKLNHKRFKEAASTFEKVIKVSPNDLEAIPGFIIACSQVDAELAEKYDIKIPPLVNDKDIDAEQLENLSAPLQSKHEELKKSDQQIKVEKKKKKKKHIKYPKNFDSKAPGPMPDAERWVPLHERSYFKKRTKKNQIGKGPQGAVPEKGSKGSTASPEPVKQQTVSKQVPVKQGLSHHKKKKKR